MLLVRRGRKLVKGPAVFLCGHAVSCGGDSAPDCEDYWAQDGYDKGHNGALPYYSASFFKCLEGKNTKIRLCPYNARVRDDIVVLLRVDGNTVMDSRRSFNLALRAPAPHRFSMAAVFRIYCDSARLEGVKQRTVDLRMERIMNINSLVGVICTSTGREGSRTRPNREV